MNKVDWLLESAAGAAIGLLVGLIAGLSISPVTQTVLGSLSAGLLILLGLKQPKESAQAAAHAVRILTFGVFCSVALLLGIFLRTHSILSPDLASQDRRLLEAKVFSQDQIDQILLLTNFGVRSADLSKPPQANAAQSNNDAGESKPGEGQDNSNIPNEERHAEGDSQPPTAALASAGLLRSGSEHFCDLARRRQFKDLNAYLDQVHRLDPKLYRILQSAPAGYKDQLSQSLDGYLCP